MGLKIKTIFDLISEEEIDKSLDERKQRKDRFQDLITKKIDKLTDEQLDNFIIFLKN